MLNYHLKVGLLPMRRNTTDRPARTFLTWSSAEARGARVVDYIEKNFATPHVSFVDTKGLGCKDLIYNDDTAAEAIARFKEADVDAVVMINANFGNEKAASRRLARPLRLRCLPRWTTSIMKTACAPPTPNAGYSAFRGNCSASIFRSPTSRAVAWKTWSLPGR